MDLSSKRLGIKDLAEDDRPREKLVNLGRQSLSDAELLAILLRLGNKRETALQLAQRMLSEHNNNISDLAKLTVSQLTKYSGIGATKAVTIVAAFELGRRRQDSLPERRTTIVASATAYQLLAPKLADLQQEEFRILLLNRANQVIREEQLSRGGISATVVDIRLLCRLALDSGASGVILAHNHPSGQTTPSREDKEITAKAASALKMFDILLLDHLIVGEQSYFSFADERLL